LKGGSYELELVSSGQSLLRRRQMSESLPLELEVLNPRGELRVEFEGLSTPRVTDLAGKTIVLAPSLAAAAPLLLDLVAELLKEKYPTANVVLLPRYPAPETVVDQCDTFIHGPGD
jgi:hypothetical protein